MALTQPPLFAVYLLYLDDAGSVGNANERYFVLAGIAVFERQVYFLQQALEDVAARTNANDPASVELHANTMQNRRNFWRAFPLVDFCTTAPDKGLILRQAQDEAQYCRILF